MRTTQSLETLNEVRSKFGQEPIKLDRFESHQLAEELGESARARDLVVYLECSPGVDGREAVENLRNAVQDHSIVQEILVDEVPDADE